MEYLPRSEFQQFSTIVQQSIPQWNLTQYTIRCSKMLDHPRGFHSAILEHSKQPFRLLGWTAIHLEALAHLRRNGIRYHHLIVR